VYLRWPAITLSACSCRLAEKLGEDDHGQQLGEVEMSWTPQAQPSRWPVVETVF
jgi:hypothetical protein